MPSNMPRAFSATAITRARSKSSSYSKITLTPITWSPVIERGDLIDRRKLERRPAERDPTAVEDPGLVTVPTPAVSRFAHELQVMRLLVAARREARERLCSRHTD